MAELRVTDITPPQAILRLVDRESIEYLELVESIRDHGLLKPVLVRERRGKWELIDGLHRYTASVECGLESIEARIISASDEEALLLALQANAISKETLPCEYAAHLRRILKFHTDMTIAGLSRLVKKSPIWISNCLTLNHLDPTVQTMVNRGEIPVQSAYMLAKIPRHKRQEYVDRARAMPSAEFKRLAAEVIRRWREQVCFGRQQLYFPGDFKLRQYLRTLREVREEFNNDFPAGHTQVHDMTPAQDHRQKHWLDGWRAAIAWVLHNDPSGMDAQKKLHESSQRGDLCELYKDSKIPST